MDSSRGIAFELGSEGVNMRLGHQKRSKKKFKHPMTESSVEGLLAFFLATLEKQDYRIGQH